MMVGSKGLFIDEETRARKAAAPGGTIPDLRGDPYKIHLTIFPQAPLARQVPGGNLRSFARNRLLPHSHQLEHRVGKTLAQQDEEATFAVVVEAEVRIQGLFFK